MNEEIKVFFKMKINHGQDESIIEFDSQGKRYSKNNKYYFLFKEPNMDSNDQNDITLICSRDELTIIRKGHVNMRQVYKENETTVGTYQNKFINSPITVCTHHYSYQNNKVFLNYDMLVEDEIIGNYEMNIEVKGVGKDE